MPRNDFWNKQYKNPTHLELSDEPAEDLMKFTRFLLRDYGKQYLNVTTRALDLGCGNGRNIIYLSRSFGIHGLGYDTSGQAIAQAKNIAGSLPLEFQIRSIAEPIPLPDSSVVIALDMMASHVLLRAQRESLREEILRVLKPSGWLFFKSFLLDDDQNAERMLKEYPGPEEGMYVHPEIGVPEYVWTENSLVEFFEPYFTIHKTEKSHKHKHADGTAWKRRTISAYLQKT